MRAFDADSVTRVLRDPIFYHYLTMCRGIEGLPDKLASFGEACPCHYMLLGKLSSYQKSKLMSAHYGKGVTSCLCSGMMGPELVAGTPRIRNLFSAFAFDFDFRARRKSRPLVPPQYRRPCPPRRGVFHWGLARPSTPPVTHTPLPVREEEREGERRREKGR